MDQAAPDESWGIANVVVDPMLVVGKGNGDWATADVDLKDADAIVPWSGSGMVAVKCSDGSAMLRARSLSVSNPTAFLKATYNLLPSHNVVKISFDFSFLHSFATMTGKLVVSGLDIWKSQRPGTGVSCRLRG